MRRERLAALHDHASPCRQVDVRADGPALAQAVLDAVLELAAEHGGVLVEDFEDVVAGEGGVGFGVDEQHVDDAGGEELDSEAVVGEDEVLGKEVSRGVGRSCGFGIGVVRKGWEGTFE